MWCWEDIYKYKQANKISNILYTFVPLQNTIQNTVKGSRILGTFILQKGHSNTAHPLSYDAEWTELSVHF